MVLVVDEDIPRALGDVFGRHGYVVLDVRDIGLRSAPDEAVFEFAVEQDALLITADLAFVSPIRFELSRLRGVLLNRLPEILSLAERVRQLDVLITALPPTTFESVITTIEVGRLRQRPLQ